MTELLIRDERLTARLRALAQQEGRSVEAVLEALLALYPAKAMPPAAQPDKSAAQTVRRKAYARARRYWESVGDTAKAALTDEELDEQFGRFDAEGIPRLKSELQSLEPPVGSLAYAAQIARSSQLHSGRPDLARRSDEILDEHFADDLLRRMRGEDAAE
jgi:hypothetical protein